MTKLDKPPGYFYILFLLLLWQTPAFAEIYKYRDENGSWKYSDKPPKQEKTQHTVLNKIKTKKNGKFTDYLQALQKKYNPNSPIEKATLSVVTIKTRMGSGSGFFISSDCHLITNRHVIRPTSTKQFKESEEKIQTASKELEDTKNYISSEEKRLSINKRKLLSKREYIDSLHPGEHKNAQEEEYQYYLKLYNRDTAALEEKITTTNNAAKKHEEIQSDFDLNSSISSIINTFNVVLKDNSKTQAYLVKIADNKDLALLKIDNCKSPFLKLDTKIKPHQGMNIYSVGSPIGMKDHVTSGIITNLSDNNIITDAKILPGNSGGPLITPEGDVIGVNTLKVSADNPYTSGFGVAIPTVEIFNNFKRYIK